MTDGKRSLRLIAIALGFVALIGLLTDLFMRAGEVSPEAHYAYMQSLRRVQQSDVELNVAVLGSYADLMHNYDPVARLIAEIGAERPSLRNFPAGLAADKRAALNAKLDELLAAQVTKEEKIDLFLRNNAVLRNSLRYFPQAAETYLAQDGRERSLAIEHFVRSVLSFGQGPAREQVARLRDELLHLQTHAAPGNGPHSLEHLLVHARVILDKRPEVDQLAFDITHAPTASLHEELTHLYTLAHEDSLRVAGYYRWLLYAVSIGLLLYVLYAIVRIDLDRRHLRQRYEAQLRAEEQMRLYAQVFTCAAEGMTITDAQSRILAVNPAFCSITGYAVEEVLGLTPAILSSGRQGVDYYRQMWRELLKRGHWQGEIWNRRKDGGIYPEWLSVAAVRDTEGATSNYIGIFTDISERKESEARIQHLAQHDALTGLPNRVLLEDRISQAILNSRRSERMAAVVFFDLDRFKNINDTLGHDVGDNLLIQAARRGQGALRDTDTLCRLGGDEFVVVLPEIEHLQYAMHVTRKLLSALGQPYVLAGHTLTVTASAGIALWPDDGQTVSELLRKADAAMYRAKEEGRNTARFYSAGINNTSLGELLLENDLRGALERGEIVMYYQPKVDAASGRLIGAEALMRWRSREHGMISPSRFIPLAEESGLIGALGEWALNDVCRQQRCWMDAGLTALPVAVNLSAHQFAQQDVPKLVADALERYRLPPELIALELTESLLMRNAGSAAKVLHALHRMRIDVAIDDFGTGYSSLSYLHQFPVQALKIDRSFVCEISEQGTTVKLVPAMIAMAHELDLAVIAEGVETEAQRTYLLKHGCDQFQGFLFGRPEPAEQMGALLAALAVSN
jgi:diguanylate cyclase (GGDEF)-like protein/PAS domain S-box-containing protein